MRAFLLRVLKNGLAVALVLALVGYGMANMAEMFTGKSERPLPETVPDIRDHLQYRIPLGLAAWGFGLVLFLEMLVSVWRKPVVTEAAKPQPVVDEAEQLLLKLLEEADAAEKARALPAPADPTPPPRGTLSHPNPSRISTRA